MKLHIESRDFAAFEMVIAKGGIKIGTGAATSKVKLHRPAEMLRTAEPRPVVDRTDLPGKFYFVFEFSSDPPPAATM